MNIAELKNLIQHNNPEDDGPVETPVDLLPELTIADLKFGAELEIDDPAKEVFGDIALYRHEPGPAIACRISFFGPAKHWPGPLALEQHLKLMEKHARTLGGDALSLTEADLNEDQWGSLSFGFITRSATPASAYREALSFLEAVHKATDRQIETLLEGLG